MKKHTIVLENGSVLAGLWWSLCRTLVRRPSRQKKKRSLVFSFPLFPLTLFKLVFSDLHLAKAAELEEPVRKAKEQWRGKERYETGDVEG